MEKSEPLYTVGEVSISPAMMENSMRLLKTLKIELPYDPPTSLLGMYPEKTVI